MNLPMHKLGKLDRMETASVDELRHEQLQRLRWSVWHAYTNVPHYRNAFDAIGLKPMDINSLEDIARIPFTCSPAALVPTTVPSASAVQLFPCRAAKPRNRFS